MNNLFILVIFYNVWYFFLLIDHATSLLHGLAKPSRNRGANLMKLLRKYSSNLDDVKDLLKVVDKKKRSILHKLALFSDHKGHNTLLDILNEFFPENDLKQKEEILMHRNGAGDTILNILSKVAETENSLKNLGKLILIYKGAGLKEKLETQKNPLKEAITTGNTKAAKVLIDNEYSLIFDKKDGLNALHSCIRYRNPELVTYILKKEKNKGEDNNLKLLQTPDRKKNTLLNYCVDLNWPELKGKIDQENEQGLDTTLPHEEARMEILESLMTDNWSDVEKQNMTEENCLHIAILNDFPKGAKFIVNYLKKLAVVEKAKGKGDKGDRESREKEKAERAERAKALETSKEAKQKMKVLLNAKNNKGLTPLFLAIQKGYADLVEMMQCEELEQDMRDNEKRTAFYYAIELDQVECLEKILPTISGGLGGTRKKRKLLCHSAEKSDGVKVFEWMLEKGMSLKTDNVEFMNEDTKKFLEKTKKAPPPKKQTSTTSESISFKSLLENDSKVENPMHSIAKTTKNVVEKYKLLASKLNDENGTLLTSYLCQQDASKNTPLHIAMNAQCTPDKLKIIAYMMKVPGTNQALTMLNTSGENCLSNLKKMPEDWFILLSEDEELRKIFIDLGDDEMLSVIIDCFKQLPSIEENTHPITLIKEIFRKKKKLDKSYTKLLHWEGEYHEDNSHEVRKCCYDEVDAKEAYLVNERIQKIIVKSLTYGYFFKKAFEGMFIIFLITKSIDFGTDITMNVSFYNTTKESNFSIFKDLPSEETCKAYADQFNGTKPVEFNLECYFHQMHKYMLFIAGLFVFFLTYITDAYFVMTDENTKQYKAIMIPGFCCWKSCEQIMDKSRMKKLLMHVYWYFVLPFFNQMLIYVYGFWVRTFVRYWNKRYLLEKAIKNKENEEVKVVTEVDDEVDDPSTKNCLRKTISNIWKLITCCCKNTTEIDQSDVKHDPYCYTNIQQNDIANENNNKILNEMQDRCDKTVIIGKIVTSATENSFMPLLQLSLLFPSFISLFPKSLEEFDVKEFVAGSNSGSNWRFAVILTSIITSLASMGIALTETYFSKSGRRTYKTKPKPRWLLYFSSIVYQVVPKIFAYQVFAFGFVPYIGKIMTEKFSLSPDLGPNLIIPVLLFLPLFLSLVRAIVFHLFAFKPRSWRESFLFGLSTMFVCSENDFHYRNEESLKESIKLKVITSNYNHQVNKFGLTLISRRKGSFELI